MLTHTFITLGSHTMRLSTLLILVGLVLIFGMAAFLAGMLRGRRVLVQRSATLDELNAHLGKIADTLERIGNRPADHVIAEASRPPEPAAHANVSAPEHAIPYSMFGR